MITNDNYYKYEMNYYHQGDKLYSIKWWRDSDQFYQYIPRNKPQQMPFNVSGISVNVSTVIRYVYRYYPLSLPVHTTQQAAADAVQRVRYFR